MPKISQEKLLARERGIVQAATRCLQRKGLEGTTMRDLFRAANLSPGAVYRYFSSKDELIAAVAEASPSLTEAALAASPGAPDRGETLRLLLATAAAADLPTRLQLELQAAALRSPGVAASLSRRRAATRRALGEALGGAAEGPPEELIDLVVALCEALARSRLLETAPRTEALAAEAGRLLEAAL